MTLTEDREAHTGFLWGNLRESPVGRPRYRWEDNIKMDLKEIGQNAWTGLIWLRIGKGKGHL